MISNCECTISIIPLIRIFWYNSRALELDLEFVLELELGSRDLELVLESLINLILNFILILNYIWIQGLQDWSWFFWLDELYMDLNFDDLELDLGFKGFGACSWIFYELEFELYLDLDFYLNLRASRLSLNPVILILIVHELGCLNSWTCSL